MAQANVKLTVDASQATRALQGVQNRTTKLQSAFGGLKTAIAGIGLGVLVKGSIQAATNFEKLNQRLRILTKDNGSFEESLKLAEQAQTKFGLSSIDALEGVTNLQARLGPLGSSMDEISAIFNGFNTAAILSGASTQEQAGAMRQLTQALGSGVLRGDEFNSISEQMSAVLKPIADQLGVNVGQLRKFAAEGKITKDVVVGAFKEIEKEGASALKKLIENDPTMVFKVLSNETEKLSIAVGTLLAPAILDGVRALTEITKAATEFFNSPIGKTAAIFAAIAFAVKGVVVILPVLSALLIKVAAAGGVLTIALNAIPFVAVATGIGAIITQLIKQKDEQNKLTEAIKKGEKAQLEALEADLGIKMAKEIAIINESTDKRTIAAAERRLAILKEQMKPIKERLDIVIKENGEQLKKNKELKKEKDLQEQIKKILKDNVAEQNIIKVTKRKIALGKTENEFDRELLQRKFEHIDKIKEIISNEKIKNKEQAISLENQLLQIDAAEILKRKLEEQGEVTDELKEKFDAIGEAIESSIKNNLRDAITGAQSFGQAMTNVLNRIRDKIIDAQIDKLIGGFGENFSAGARNKGGKGIGGFLGGILGGLFANGGRPPVGKASIVGERGPELFVPKVAGTIIPNSKLGGGDNVTNMVTVNVDASGSSVSGNNADAQALGAVIGAAVQAQLVKEKRAGGLLSR